MEKISCSVPVLALNRRKELERCLPKLAGAFNDVFVIDGNSTDGTIEYVKSLGLRIERQLCAEEGANAPIDDFRLERLHSWELCKNDWVVYFDSDEIPTNNFIEMVRKAVLGDTHLVHTAKKQIQLANGSVVTSSPFYDANTVRVFARSSGATLRDRKVHERFELPEGVRFCDHPNVSVICPDPDPKMLRERCMRYLTIEETSFLPQNATWEYLFRWIVWFNIKNVIGQFLKVVYIQCLLMWKGEVYLPWSYNRIFLVYRFQSILSISRAWMVARRKMH